MSVQKKVFPKGHNDKNNPKCRGLNGISYLCLSKPCDCVATIVPQYDHLERQHDKYCLGIYRKSELSRVAPVFSHVG